MKTKVGDLRALMDALHKKTGEPKNTQGWKNIGELVGKEKLGERYLYKSIVNKIKGKKDSESVGQRLEQLDDLANFLEFKNFKTFTESVPTNLDSQLESCIGSYYSYIRMNAKETVLLQSPVRIFYQEGKYKFEQKGKDNKFTGDIRSEKGCLFILMDSKGGKSFYHSYKIGPVRSPEVMQGIFAGVSASFDPIGGRVVLMRVEEDFEKLKSAKVETAGKDRHLKILFSYFKEYSVNNLALARSTGFSLEDLK